MKESAVRVGKKVRAWHRQWESGAGGRRHPQREDSGNLLALKNSSCGAACPVPHNRSPCVSVHFLVAAFFKKEQVKLISFILSSIAKELSL